MPLASACCRGHRGAQAALAHAQMSDEPLPADLVFK